MIRFTCDKCGYRVKAPEDWAGRKGKCPKCHHHVAVPLDGQPLVGSRVGVGTDARGHLAVAVSRVEAGRRVQGNLEIKPCLWCGGAVLADADACVHCHRPLAGSTQADPVAAAVQADIEQLEREYRALQRFRRSCSHWSLLYGVPGFILVTISNIMILTPPAHPDPMMVPAVNPWAVGLGLAGIVPLTIGLVYCAKYKGRNPLWGLVGLLTIIGLIVLCCIRDLNRERMLVITQMLHAARHRGQHACPVLIPHTSGWAIASLILGLCSLFTCGITAILGFLLGICGLHDIKRSQGRVTGQGLAIAGICISGFFLAVMLLGMIAGFLGAISDELDAQKHAASAGAIRQVCVAVPTCCRQDTFTRWAVTTPPVLQSRKVCV